MAYNQGSNAAEDYFGKRRNNMANQPDNGFFKGYDTNTGAAEGRANPKPKKNKMSQVKKQTLRRQGRL